MQILLFCPATEEGTVKNLALADILLRNTFPKCGEAKGRFFRPRMKTIRSNDLPGTSSEVADFGQSKPVKVSQTSFSR
jgi:hypothetical protein